MRSHQTSNSMFRSSVLLVTAAMAVWFAAPAFAAPQNLPVATSLPATGPAQTHQLTESQMLAMPEGSREQKIAKAYAAVSLERFKEAVRLLQPVLQQNPADLAAVQMMSNIHIATGRRDLAIALVQEAIKRSPGSADLKLTLAQLQGAPREQIAALTEQAIQAEPDPFTREMRACAFLGPQGKIDEAIQRLDAAEKIKPNDATVIETRFDLLIAKRAWDDAQAVVQRIADLDLDRAKGLTFRFRLAMSRGDRDGAMQVVRELTGTQPNNSRSWLLMGNVRQARGLFDEAIASYALALEKDPANNEALRGIIDCCQALRKPQESQRYIEAAIKASPDNAYFKEMALQFELAWGDPGKAIGQRMRDRTEAPDVVQKWVALGLAYSRVAQVQKAAGHEEESNLALKAARDTFIEAMNRFPDEAILYQHAADLAFTANSADEGEAILQRLAARPVYKDRYDVSLMLADYYARWGKNDQAEAALKDAIKKSGNAAEVQLRLASLYLKINQPNNVLNVLDENSPNRNAQRLIVQALLASKNMAKAEALLLRLASANPNDSEFVGMLGFLFLQTGRPQQALAALDHSLAIEPGNTNSLYWRATARLKYMPGDLEQVMHDLLLAREIKTDSAEVRLLLADVYELKAATDKAVTEVEAVLALAPWNKDVRMRLIGMYTRAHPPRWDDAQRLINDAMGTPVGKKDPDWFRVIARIAATRIQSDQAIAAMRQALALAPDDPRLEQEYLSILLNAQHFPDVRTECDRLQKLPAFEKMPWLYQVRALAECKAEDRPAALRDFETALDLAGAAHDDNAIASLAMAVNQSVGYDALLRQIDTRIHSNHVRWRMIGAFIMMYKGDMAEAANLIAPVLANTESLDAADLPAALKLAGSIYVLANDTAKAEAVYRQILQKWPDDTTAMNNLACLLCDCVNPPRPREALEYTRKMMDIITERGTLEPRLMDTHAWALILCGSLEEGVSLLEKIVQRSALPEAYYHLGEGYMRGKHAREAVPPLEKAKALIDAAKKAGRHYDKDLEQKVDTLLQQAKKIRGPW